ncbi:hypothetical protein V8C43DRAFT_33744 [Trichoderma afarasin]
MADTHEQQHKNSNGENKVSMAKRVMTNAKISKSEREAFESKIESLEKALKLEKEVNEMILKNERKMAKLTHEAYAAVIGEDARSMGMIDQQQIQNRIRLIQSDVALYCSSRLLPPGVFTFLPGM